MIAIVFRQEKILRLLLGGKYAKLGFFSFSFEADEDENNLLHLAGLLPPPQQLAKISGAALQMQRELQWFKSVMPTKFVAGTNSKGYTRRQLFTKNHKQSKDEWEKWMKETASSSTVVGTLVITVIVHGSRRQCSRDWSSYIRAKQ
ncbi:hypothetical protein Tsubulata_050440, partial [Turnera subulata]